MNENTVWTDSQDYGADEILHISKKRYLQNHQNHKRNYHSFQGPTPIISSESSQNLIFSR